MLKAICDLISLIIIFIAIIESSIPLAQVRHYHLQSNNSLLNLRRYNDNDNE